MAENPMNRSESTEPGTAAALEQEYEVELAGLSESEAAQVEEAMSEAEFSGELDGVDVEQEILDAQFADEARGLAEDAQREQASAADAGDYSTAREKAEQVQQRLDEAGDTYGGNFDTARAENAHDVQVLEEAESSSESADDAFDDATEYAEADADDAYDAAADDAYNDAEAADDYADQGNQGGTYGDQSIYADS